MAALETLRTKAGVLLAVIIGLALLSFVLGDLFGNGGRSSLFSSNDVGEINGHSIPYEDYNAKVEYFTDIYRIAGRADMNEAVTDEIREQAWYALVQQYAVEPEWEHLGLAISHDGGPTISSDELFDLIQGKNPSPIIRNYFTNPQTGEFDRVNVLQYLQNIDNDPNPDAKPFWLYLEREIVQQRIQAKLLALVGKSLYATTLEAQEAVGGSINSADIEYVSRALSTLSDSIVQVSSGDIKKYYNKNKKRYRQTESCDIEYVTLPVAASAEDDVAVKGWIEELAPQFAASEDARLFSAQHSDVAFDDGYYKQSELSGAVADFAFTKTQADILPPYKDGDWYKMSRIAEIRNMPDTVQARHILLAPRETMDATRALADSIKTAIRRGADFAALSTQYSVDEAAKQKGGDLGRFGYKAMVKPFGDSCFFAVNGKVMIVETRFGVHIVQVTDKTKDEKKVQIATIQREVTPSKITRTDLFSRMNDIATQATDRESFRSIIAEKNMSSRTATRVTINDKSVQSLQNARDLVRWAWKADKDAVSPIFEISNNFVIATLAQHHDEGYTPVKEVSQEITSTLRQQKKGEILLAETDGMDVEAAAGKYNLTPQTATGINYSAFYIPNVGVEPRLAASVSVTPEGKTASVAGNTGVYVYRVIAVHSNATPDAVGTEKTRMQQMASQRAGYEILNVLRSAAEVKDRRGEIMY